MAPATAPAPPMSHFIASMPGGRLDRDAAGIEGHALADEGDRLAAFAAAVPLEDQQARLAHRALGDAEQRAHAELLHRRAVEHLDLDAAALERRADALDEGLGVDDVGRLGDQLAGQRHALDNRRPALRRSACAAPSPPPTMTTSFSVGFCLSLSLVR